MINALSHMGVGQYETHRDTISSKQLEMSRLKFSDGTKWDYLFVRKFSCKFDISD